MAESILSIDLGTTAVKVAVFRSDGSLLDQATVEYELLTPKANWVEAPTEIYLQSVKSALDSMRANTDLGSIRAVGFSAQGETLFFVDEQGRALRNAIVWMDNRADEEAEILRARFGDERCYEVTGQVSFESCWPAAKVLWVKRHEPEVFEKTRKVLLIEDYLIYRLTGKYVAEGSLLTSTEYWDIRSKKYWPEMLEAIGLTEEMLPEIRESGEAVGRILPEAAKLLGISDEAIICTGCLDQAAGAIGVGNVRPGIFSENIGAALAVCVPTEKLTYDPARLMPVHYFAIPDTYMMHTFTTGGMTLRWFRDTFCDVEMDAAPLLGADSYELLSQEASTVNPGSEGLVMLPHLNGSMAPDVNTNARGVFYGFTMKHRRPHFIRAIMESIGYIVKRNVEVIEDMGIEVKEIRSLGGGSKSPVWSQIKADILGKTLYTMDCKEAGCLGAAILAGKAVGIFTDIDAACESMIHVKATFVPKQANKEVYENRYGDYCKLFGDMTEMFARTAAAENK